MRLKRLELVGFKSFANRIKFDFDQGITAIVGPNGSGKSNISDSVRWVLGEQSMKSLRGAKLEDVIFAGTDGKRALGMAEVQLTLDNTDGFLPIDYNEVTITRRVYRSGESDFLINKNACRLKDIQDLLTDTGLGREGYSIIGQGQVDAVLSANAEGRRILLEETAGIVKYRNRKEQALRKMEHTDADLVRVTDILNELNEQLVPLETEAKKARQYQIFATELETVELDLYALMLNELAGHQETLNSKLKQNKLEGEALSLKYNELEQAIHTDEGQVDITNRVIEQLQNTLMEVSEQINQAAHDIDLTEERLANNKQQKESLDTQKQTHEQEVTSFQNQLVLCSEELASNQAALANAKSNLKRYEQVAQQARVTLQNGRIAIEDKKDEFVEFVRTLADARNFKRNYQQQFTTLKQQITTLEGERQELIESIAANKSSVDQTNIGIKSLEAQQEHSSLASIELGQKLDGAQKQAQRATEHEKTAIGQYQQTKSRLTALQELEENYEGYSFSVRKLMEQDIPDVTLLGTVADVIKVPEGFETAYEVALGGNLQNLITPTEQDAKKAIEWLKKHRAGRATFLPLKNMQGRSFPANYEQYWQQPDCHGPAVDLLEFDEVYRPAIAALLGRVAIVEDLDTALLLQRKLPSFSRIVTKAGEVVMPNGSLTGGSINTRTSGLLARKNEIAKLETALVSQATAVKQCTKEKETALDLVAKLRLDIEHNSQSLYQTQLDLNTLHKDLSRLGSEANRLAKLLSVKDHQLEEHCTAVSELDNQAAATKENVALLEAEEVAKEAEISALEDGMNALEAKVSEEEEVVTNHRIQITQQESLIKELDQRHIALTQQIKQTHTQVANITNELNVINQQTVELNSSLVGKQAELERARADKLVKLSDLNAKKQERAGIQEQIKISNEELKRIRQALNRIDKAIYNDELELNRIELDLERVKENLAELDIDEHQVRQRQVEHELEFLKQRTLELKLEIKELGIVNLGSLQDYESVKERCFFLQRQLDDLTQAKESLLEAIREMDATSSERFLETYEVLRLEFQQLFSRLFRGGKADLVLTAPDDILNTGVDIIAQPPGKKLQNLSLLSGGERALTAIALLFAIRKVKPTPFCILDEIDAALDDANLQRFTDLLEIFAADTQFLVITHRQLTMGVANRLYGVTMGENATSQIISVQLS